ncbi:Bax inhibitor 1 [Branchiostoma belcheri]|nr:Bax inhibitor 1 [Branchiostoma belcheri]
MASGDDNQFEDIDNRLDQTGQSRSQSLKVGNLSRNELVAALKPNPMYAGVGTLQKDPTSTSDYHNQTGQGQSLAIPSLKVGNLSHNKLVAALKPNPMYAGVGTPQKDPTCTSDYHNQTGQGQSLATKSLKVGNLSHKEVIAALKPNPMYAGVGTPQKDLTCTSDHNQTGQGQSQAIQSLKVGNLSHNELVAALKPNPMYAGVGTPQKDPTCTSDYHNQTGQGQSLTIPSLKVGNLSHKELVAALKPNPMYAGVGTLQKDLHVKAKK